MQPQEPFGQQPAVGQADQFAGAQPGQFPAGQAGMPQTTQTGIFQGGQPQPGQQVATPFNPAAVQPQMAAQPTLTGIPQGGVGGEFSMQGGCPQCSSHYAQNVKWSWWGGFLGPKIMKQVKCMQCFREYNSKTGKAITGGTIAIYTVVSLVIGFGFIGMLLLLIVLFI